jgi:hypothetical protein
MAPAAEPRVTLTIDLIGRICIATHQKQRWALFLTAPANKSLGIRRNHLPMLTTSVGRVATQEIADASLGAIGRAEPTSRDSGTADSLGVWSLTGYDLALLDVAARPKGVVSIDSVANLNAILAKVRPGAKFNLNALSENPSRSLIASRLRLPPSASLSAFAASKTPRTFEPGGHSQVLADFVRVQVPWANSRRPPSLSLRRFGSRGRATIYTFTPGDSLSMTMSNLCTCVEQQTPTSRTGVVNEDQEFVVYYTLLAEKLPADKRPVPHLNVVAKGIESPECYRPSRANF